MLHKSSHQKRTISNRFTEHSNRLLLLWFYFIIDKLVCLLDLLYKHGYSWKFKSCTDFTPWFNTVQLHGFMGRQVFWCIHSLLLLQMKPQGFQNKFIVQFQLCTTDLTSRLTVCMHIPSFYAYSQVDKTVCWSFVVIKMHAFY